MDCACYLSLGGFISDLDFVIESNEGDTLTVRDMG